MLIALHSTPSSEELAVWLLKRPAHMRTHGSQVAFPGGRRDDTDETPAHTALREAQEEIGLPPRSVTLLGPMDDLLVPSGFLIRPQVAYVSEAFTPVPNAAEVARVFQAPIDAFAQPPVGEFPRWGNDMQGEFVWGATFYMGRELALMLRRLRDG